ncbi:hypothetical protein STCU_07345 [Strigomonas culicis]|uniref:Uncharacterized protein n=1 Tax=Strigomonas culicis TaxID=28005 RepID=S9U5N6_9TRYP|nr:hypothetical protein STCU_07345 [Strigomonas culicis]|eukprot:EPY24054.1 hypothetical protein STCU_07345 [Strigomonas culicis]
MDLQRNSQPHILLVYDAMRTSILGRPYIRAFVPSENYINYYNKTQEKSAVHLRPQELLQQAEVTKYGVLREVPVEIAVDAYHALNFENFVTAAPPDSFEVIQQPVIMDYVKALVDAVQDGTESLTQMLESEGKQNAKEQNQDQPLAQRVDALLSLQHVRELAQHLEGICDSLLLNTSMMREL